MTDSKQCCNYIKSENKCSTNKGACIYKGRNLECRCSGHPEKGIENYVPKRQFVSNNHSYITGGIF